ncbi:argininosuccinate lyase [Thermoanaerobacter brockii subsp. lactiethylicus]|jgi:argininosuccinate lyase|uniref:Argininosuccinate lyase n=3 Tax=Thermoanaerobacter TaxID=1754 RepID=ARLY_THEP3|nr:MULTISPECIES: argininosuccinate lyase [Thermoanaerobacter]B0K4D9.1 RecName: Full=Argininosuccinate lyase; Short=ASAL; AltName: Full=Arginosuccinase [Thermoanaerobacter sp. X514]B0KBW6.1 RecName: Full=Argininosuccinate lyase; Short=ASAL; AltName: Full=Arginosuccinase [Thermoanaerobacter pseudethanolicus ATCC 33223]KUJ90806.1 MAG: argininosuccinate lyase [Thermoanaerobacter thermocopriae]ABY91972.1 argininosuccinate lyase [Thermoanaerobacter sp. X514]ABY93902.1 argininosuccinate lyase [Thermo
MKLWGGRFKSETDKLMEEFNSSISFDIRLLKHDILGSIAHAKGLYKAGVLTEDELNLIEKGLKEILDETNVGEIPNDEDVHSYVERLLTEKIGDVGRKLHTGRSRNDQVATDERLYLRDEIDKIKEDLIKLIDTLKEMAETYKKAIMPGYTHLQRAQPVTFGHHLLAYVEMFKRDLSRLEDMYKRVNVMPLGSGALAGTTFDIDRKYVASLLGFDDITLNSMDGVSDRDFVIEFLSFASITMMHLSRFCEELILWSTKEFDFIEMDDRFSTGSSMMPQKKNPDAAELIRGKTGRVYGDLITILTVMKGLSLAYNKDMQEDKEALFDGIDTLKMSLKVFTEMIKTIKVKTDNMEKAAKYGYMNATDFADYLVSKGIPFRTAHEIAGKVVLYAIERNLAIEDLPLNELKKFSDVIDEDVYEAIDLKNTLKKKKTIGAPTSIQS